jgi:hypothetical protein
VRRLGGLGQAPQRPEVNQDIDERLLVGDGPITAQLGTLSQKQVGSRLSIRTVSSMAMALCRLLGQHQRDKERVAGLADHCVRVQPGGDAIVVAVLGHQALDGVRAAVVV